jgi:hypothetical protein
LSNSRFSLDIPGGLVTGESNFAGQGRYVDGSYFRFVQSSGDLPARPETVGGFEAMTLSSLDGVCRNSFAWTDTDGRLNYAFGTHTSLFVWRDGSLFDITPVGLAAGEIDGTAGRGYGISGYGDGDYGAEAISGYFPRTWTFGALGEALIACPRGETIFIWENDTSTPAVAVANAPAYVTAVIVTDEDALMAFGCSEEVSGDYNPVCIRHSGVRDASGSNETVWTTGTSTTAREIILSGGGRLVTARNCGSGALCWTNNQIAQVTYIGAIDEVYRVEPLGKGGGALGANSVAVDQQTAYYVSPDLQVRACALGGAPTVITLPFRSDLEAYLAPSQQDKVVLSTLQGFEELWIYYPDSRDGMENSRAFSLNLKYGAPARHVLARTSFIDAGVGAYPVGVTLDGRIYYHERGNSADGGALSGFLEAGAQYIAPNQSMVMITSFWPDFQALTAPVTLTLIGREYPEDEPFLDGPYTIAPGQSKVDVHFQARLIGFRYDFNSGPARIRLGTPVVEGRPTGSR